MHACKYRRASPINRVQRIGANAIVGTFLTVATSVAEAEAHIPSADIPVMNIYPFLRAYSFLSLCIRIRI
jgi:hypothetical protein